MRYPNTAFIQKKLAVHDLLSDVPLLDVWEIILEGGGGGRTMADVRAMLIAADPAELNPLARFLFALRARMGQWFGWDAPPDAPQIVPPGSYLHRLPDALRAASETEPGEVLGPVRVLYQLPEEWLAETINATTHAFLHFSLHPAPEGHYRAYLAVYAQHGAWWSRYYMALIEPFRLWVVYPSVIRFLAARWRATYAR
ncbi:MAG: DUF2867 domain-containing protein [Anaerolineales bacterium]